MTKLLQCSNPWYELVQKAGAHDNESVGLGDDLSTLDPSTGILYLFPGETPNEVAEQEAAAKTLQQEKATFEAKRTEEIKQLETKKRLHEAEIKRLAEKEIKWLEEEENRRLERESEEKARVDQADMLRRVEAEVLAKQAEIPPIPTSESIGRFSHPLISSSTLPNNLAAAINQSMGVLEPVIDLTDNSASSSLEFDTLM
jgi:hypothetical protein